ncbi:MAG TPA: alpha/beta hydrolase [Anaeromyxobacteraceae bacterium]|nr:alpha/beta hydrolase [Anaeromyxobacteraceae bacterium]
MIARRWLKRIGAGLLAITVLGAGLAYRAYRSDMTAIRARLEAGSQVAATRCGPVEYAIRGEGPPVVVVHATGGSYDQGLLIGRVFVGDGYRVIAPSRFGHLRTPQAADATAEGQADMLACLMDALRVERAPVLGMSAGGPVALQLALRHAERVTAMVLLSTAAYIPPSSGVVRRLPAPDIVYRTLFSSDFLFWGVVRVAGPALAASFGATPELQARIPPEEKAFLAAMIEGMLPIRMHTAGLANDAALADRSFVTPYPTERIGAPVLVVQAQDDTAAVPAGGVYLAEHIPGAKLVLYPDGGHALLGHHAEIKAEVRAFLGRAGAAPR